jgi:drug/metabolite transporter (DMT)-like permease
VANGLMVFILHKHYPVFHGQIEWLYLLIFAVASVVASWSLTRGIKLIEAGATGVLGLLEIVFGIVFGIIFFHEKIGLLVALGIILILAAAAIPYFKDYNAKRGTLDPV